MTRATLKRFFVFSLLMAFAATTQSCKTTGSHKVAGKTKPIPHRQNESFALMDESASVDPDILKRGNKVRGLSEY